MPQKTCFVIMPIGDQALGNETITASDLKKRYDNLIKEAILQVDSTLDVVRADEVAIPGTITSDILTRIMHSDYVVADVSYPNPNVFYELGMRHACRIGTVIIKDKKAPTTPFDIAHQRCIEYENTPTGLKELAEQLKRFLHQIAENPDRPDNQLLELAKLTGYSFYNYGQENDRKQAEEKAFISCFGTPEVQQVMARNLSGVDADLAQALMKNPEALQYLAKAMSHSGELSRGSAKPQQRTSSKNKRKKKRR